MAIEEIDDSTFTRDMQILWQHIGIKARGKIASTIQDYYHIGNRSDRLINKLQTPPSGF